MGFHMKQFDTTHDETESAQDMVDNVCVGQGCGAEIDKDASPPPEQLLCCHWLCPLCAKPSRKSSKKKNQTCPACLAALPMDVIMKDDITNELLDPDLNITQADMAYYTSSKVDAVLNELTAATGNS